MKKLSLALRLKNMKPGHSFIVNGERERQRICRIAKSLTDSESIKHQIVTVHLGNGIFKAAAI